MVGCARPPSYSMFIYFLFCVLQDLSDVSVVFYRFLVLVFQSGVKAHIIHGDRVGI